MNDKAKPISFSEHFKLDKEELTKLGVFDPLLNFDTKLFVEPFLLRKSSSPFMKAAFETYNDFFRKLLIIIKASKEPDDKCWRQAKRLIHFPEYKATCIGYGSNSINGSGSGRNLNEKILQSAKEIVDFAIENPNIFQLLPLLEEGIGADIISDMTQTIIDDHICQYTVDIMEKIRLRGLHPYRTKPNQIYMLAYNSYYKCPIKLLPLDVLSNLPMVEDFDNWILDATQINSELRDAVNQHIGHTWFEANKSDKKESLLELIKSDKDFFFVVLRTLQESTLDHYDVDQDYQGLRRWLEDSKKFIHVGTFNKVKSIEDKKEALFQAINDIVTQFQDLIENQELWRIFWTKHRSELKHVNELYSQMLFYMVCNSWLAAQDSNVSVERYFNSETKQINFVFSTSQKCRVTVQVKHSDNFSGLEKTYVKQHTLYTEGKAERSFYVVMNFNELGSEQLKTIKLNEKPDCKIITIDTYEKASESCFNLDDECVWFEDFEFGNNRYFQEKRKGGQNSYQAYKPLKNKVEELCLNELGKKSYPSANKLCDVTARKIEQDFPELLTSFLPYQQFKHEGTDWTKPTFYGWCNAVYKSKEKAFPG